MSYNNGIAALGLEMPERVPRTEYSATEHWPLVSHVTGINVDHTSGREVQTRASREFMGCWNYDFIWNILISREVLTKCRTNMGHAVYAAGGVDYDDGVRCPFSEPEEVLAFDPFAVYGEIDRKAAVRAFEADYRQKTEYYADGVNMTGVYITLISGLIEIFGWEMLLLAMGTDATGFGQVANRYAQWIGQYFEALAEADVPVVMIHDDIAWTEGAIFNPAWYREYVFPNYKKLFSPILESGKKLIYTSDGNYTQFIDDIAACHVNGFVLEPLTDMRYIAEKYGKTHVFIGNADTRILLYGTREQIYDEVRRCMDIGKGCPGFFMAVGNHIPANTPIDNALYYEEIYRKLSKR